MIRTARKLLLTLSVLPLLIYLAGCDAYSLTDEFYPVPELSLRTQKSTLTVNSSTPVYPSGGIDPYTFTVRANDLYYDDGNPVGEVIDGQFIAGDSVGCVQILLADASGQEVWTYVSVIPPTPENFSVSVHRSNAALLEWTYPHWKYITGFIVYRSVDGSPFENYSGMLGNSDSSYIDSGLPPNKSYRYKLYAVARTSQEFYSLPTPEQTFP